MENRSLYGEPYRGASGGGDAMSTIGTLLFGAVLGAAIALLMAPKSGMELRSDIAEEASKMGEKISATTHDVTDTVKSKINQLGSKAEEMGDEAERMAHDTSSKM